MVPDITADPDYLADDLSGKGAEISGGRWNRKGTAVCYAASSRALACLESVVHLAPSPLPLNRYLVEIEIPQQIMDGAIVFTKSVRPGAQLGWDAEPAGGVSLDWGQAWIAARNSALALVPSIIVPEELNLLINPAHPDASKIKAWKMRKWLYDARLL